MSKYTDPVVGVVPGSERVRMRGPLQRQRVLAHGGRRAHAVQLVAAVTPAYTTDMQRSVKQAALERKYCSRQRLVNL